MFINSKSLSRLAVLLLIPVQALAEVDTHLSGFVFNTTFSDSSWYNDRTVSAINIDILTDSFAVRSQVATVNSPVRRFTVEKDFYIAQRTEGVVKVGKFARLSSFYNSVVDTPAASGTALLPQAGYSYRMYTGAFVLMEGVQTAVSYRTDATLVTVVTSYGKMSIPSQPDIIQELFKRKIADIKITPANGILDLVAQCETSNFNSYLSSSQYEATVEQTAVTPTSTSVSKNFNKAKYVLNKAGIRWDSGKYFAQTEYIDGRTDVWSKSNVQTSKVRAVDYNYIAGTYLTNKQSVHAGFSHGRNKTSATTNIDRVVGYTIRYKRAVGSVEYHKGAGTSWRKYDSNISAWNSFVTSITYQF